MEPAGWHTPQDYRRSDIQIIGGREGERQGDRKSDIYLLVILLEKCFICLHPVDKVTPVLWVQAFQLVNVL